MEKCTPTRIVHWLESVRNRATTRRNARSPIAKLALQRPWVLLWVGQRSRATIDRTWENTTCKTDIFVPLVVPGLSVNSGSNSSSTTLPQESLGPDAPQSLETRLHQDHLQIQYQSEVTNELARDWDKNPWRMTRKMRTIRWQIFHSG